MPLVIFCDDSIAQVKYRAIVVSFCWVSVQFLKQNIVLRGRRKEIGWFWPGGCSVISCVRVCDIVFFSNVAW